MVSTAVRVALTQSQWEALVAFTFNVGVSAFHTSTLLRLLNRGDYASVPAQLRRWVKEKHKDGSVTVNDGLVNRREAEIKHWNLPE